MKILFVSDARSGHTKRWAEYFVQQGHEVMIASLREETIPSIDVITLKTYGLGKIGYFFTIPQLRKIYKSFQPDIIHAHHVTSYGFLSALAKIKPLIITAWGSDLLISPQKKVSAYLITKYALKKANVITTVAEHMNKYVYRYCKTCKDVEAIPFGVDLKLFKYPKIKRYNINNIKIISTRNFTSVYSIDTLIKAIAIVVNQGLEIEVNLVGEGILKQKLKKLVKELKLEKVITFSGYVNPQKIVEYLQEADVFISTSISDGNNISLNEAMACGCFPIVTNIPANTQWIEDTKNGLLFNIYDYKKLAKQIMKLSDIYFINEVLKKNRKIVEEKASWQNCVNNMEEKYNQLLIQNIENKHLK